MKAKSNLVRIGCYSAFWGDSVSAATQLIKAKGLDYLVADYLAEVTMGILARRRNQSNQKSSNNEEGKDLGGAGEGGYIAEFISFVLKQNLPDIIKRKIKIVTNAGGLDPLACKLAIESAIQKAGIKEGQIIVAAITGDDILNRKNELKNDFKKFSHIYDNETDSESYPSDKEKEIISLNAYLGAFPIAKALDEGATIVVTGRCVDKCGCQVTGGNFTDWEQSVFSPNGGWINMGYPIIECFSNGEFIVTKPRETGGLVTTSTVGEQMLYEILDPGSYILPDVILDMRNVKLKQIDVNKVLVTGAKGRPPTDSLKLSGIYQDVAHSILLRTRIILAKLKFKDLRNLNVETLGAEHIYGIHARTRDTREVVLNITAVTSMAPGITGRPHPSPCLVHFSCLLPKSKVSAIVTVGNKSPLIVTFDDLAKISEIPESPEIQENFNINNFNILVKIPLIKLAWGRSGDKGDTCNIGIVKRYELPGINGLNFVLTKRGLSSLRIDRQGKTYAQMLLSFKVVAPAGLFAKL
ncbi:520_t:CDS:10 [Diversispora eburnea]|uniref:520_t:CDS:1 n=1 Tax=Diversispora eburnea TaxID=1213867 RepID=A0A9N8UVK7_9GLOM|nr:520_t:CDS:10 [Diversispora eburnea]